MFPAPTSSSPSDPLPPLLPPPLQRLTEAAEKAKIELSSTTQTSISLPFITATADGPKHIDTSLTRAKFEQLCADLLERCRIPVEQALKVCVGGCGGVCTMVGVWGQYEGGVRVGGVWRDASPWSRRS